LAEPFHPARGDGAAVRGEHARGRDLAQRGIDRCGSPGREERGRQLTRVGFLGSGLVAAAGAFGGYAAQAAAAESAQVWGLDPSWGEPGACGCAACASCLSHAANKLFASAAAADAGRAHPYCKCLVAPLVRLDEDVYRSLFVNGGGRDSVDRRYQWVQAVLTHHSPAGQASLSPAAATSVRGARVHAVLGRVRIRRTPNGQRWLFVDVETEQDVTATLAITRQGPTIARRVITGVSGSRRLKIAIPASAKAGPARLRMRVRTASGATRLVTTGIQIPHP
jgi:hypothetical protein